MILYNRLSSIGFLKNSYTLKFLFVAFLGIHIPLIGLIFFLVFFGSEHSPTMILLLVLLLTLAATGITLFVLKKLIYPIKLASKSLDAYRLNRTISTLETDSEDEVGQLINNIRETIRSNENLLTQKQDLTYLFTHDLKNYASNPAGLAKMILDENPTGTIKQFAELILESSEKQKTFLNTFITLMKEEEELSRRPVRIKSIDVNSLVNNVKEQLSPKLRSKEIELEISIQIDSIPLKIDKELLTRVIVNLVDNAIKFSYSGGCIKLIIKKEHSELLISVVDTGVGFLNSNSELLFKKFTPLGRIGTANEESTGIGLYLCRQIIEKSGGLLYAESKGPDKGATFTISLRAYKRL